MAVQNFSGEPGRITKKATGEWRCSRGGSVGAGKKNEPAERVSRVIGNAAGRRLRRWANL
jgi:hypothetical protein